jgi:CIC family chloride channel protein
MAAAPSQRFERFFPFWLRAFVRTREIGLVLAAIVIGAVSGLLVAAMSQATQNMHVALFGIPIDERLSAQEGLVWWRAVLITTMGGGVLALLAWWAGNRFRGRLADAIEANALHGGRLSVGGSIYITAQTLISNGFGMSVGLEAAYTQICAAVASLLGRGLAARRADMRLLVACGAAGGIAAAFGAPLTGSFYGFEVVLGAYTVGSLVPVVASAVVATFVANWVTPHEYLAVPSVVTQVSASLFVHVVVLGIACALFSILLMQAVAVADRLFGQLKIAAALRPIIGGAMVGGLAILTPEVLGAGHGALQANLIEAAPIDILAGLILLKCLASAVSLGSGFRGGLFFASILLGGLIGRLYAEIAALTPFPFDIGTAAIAGIAAVGSGVVGAPMAMVVLSLETTGDLSVSVAALVASAIAALIVRELFGYSFATWRFHLRGETIRGPHDVGWIRDLNVGRLMRKDAPTLPSDVTIEAARAMFPLGSTKQLFLLDHAGRYAGLVLTADLHTATQPLSAPVATLALPSQARLVPQMNIRQALDAFEESETDVLAVIDDDASRHVLGLVTEAHALRRYGEELERRNREIVQR